MSFTILNVLVLLHQLKKLYNTSKIGFTPTFKSYLSDCHLAENNVLYLRNNLKIEFQYISFQMLCAHPKSTQNDLKFWNIACLVQYFLRLNLWLSIPKLKFPCQPLLLIMLLIFYTRGCQPNFNLRIESHRLGRKKYYIRGAVCQNFKSF